MVSVLLESVVKRRLISPDTQCFRSQIPAVLLEISMFHRSWSATVSAALWGFKHSFPEKHAGWKHHSGCPHSLCRYHYLPGSCFSIPCTGKNLCRLALSPGLYLSEWQLSAVLPFDNSSAFSIDLLADVCLRECFCYSFLCASFLDAAG